MDDSVNISINTSQLTMYYGKCRQHGAFKMLSDTNSDYPKAAWLAARDLGVAIQ